MAWFSKLVSREAPVRLAHALWVVAGLLVAGAAVVLMIYLSTVSDSTRAASDLAELRTYAKNVALGADEEHRGMPAGSASFGQRFVQPLHE